MGETHEPEIQMQSAAFMNGFRVRELALAPAMTGKCIRTANGWPPRRQIG